MYQYLDEKGLFVDIVPLEKSHPSYEKAIHLWDDLISSLSEYNDWLGDKFLEGKEISEQEIVKAIKHTLRTTSSVALHCGSALKNRGIQPLMESILKYLPSPLEKPAVVGLDRKTTHVLKWKQDSKEKMCALVFKVINDP